MTHMTTPDWRTLAETLAFRVKPFIDGRFVESRSSDSFASLNPATGAVLCDLPVGNAADVDHAVAAARRSFEDGRWSRTSPLHRKAILLRIADLIEHNGDELALLDCLEMGKAISAARAEIAFSAGFFRFYGEAVDKLNGTVVPSSFDTLSLGLLEPRGVVGAIVPWNFPLANAALKAAPALAAGNSVVLKPSEVASLSALRLAEIITEAGVPDGVFNVLPGLGAAVGEPMGRHGDIDLLSFTGSTATGRKLMCYSGESNGKPLHLECGGKSPQLICADMADDIAGVAARVVHDAFWNQGQWCAAKSRLIVEEGIYDQLLDAVVEASARLVPGDTLDPATNFGAIATDGQYRRVQSFIEGAMADGAQCVTPDVQGLPEGPFIAPTIFADISPDMRLAREEVFGPVLSVMRFTDFEDGLRIANDTRYGLAANVWTRDSRRAHMAMRGIRAGRVIVRASATASEHSGFAMSAEPWGASGFGIEGGMDGMRAYCRLKAVEMVR